MLYESSSKDQKRILLVAKLDMRANPEWQNIPVIVLTAKDLTEEDRRILSGRVEQIVEKGARAHDQVVELIHQVVDHA